MDCYFLRRFLDKDYSRKNVVYAGGYHSATYVSMLVREFGFKITNYSYLKYDLNKTIDKIKKSECIYDLVIPVNNVLQCSNLTGFPRDFN